MATSTISKVTRDLGTAIVTGGSRGIGAAVAILAARAGFRVAVNYLQDVHAANLVIEKITAGQGCALAIQGDVASEADVLRLFETSESKLGPVRALINNAGTIGRPTRVESLSADMVARVLAVNVVGTMLCSREAVRRMSTRNGGAGGAIVNVSSIASRLGSANEWVHYAASKAAVNTFTIGLAGEVATEGIRVNVVSPGFIDTELHANAGLPGRLQRMSSSVPMQRPGTAEEVAEAVLWLMSPAASYITGAVLEVGGGR